MKGMIMDSKTMRLSRRDLMVASGMLAVGAGSGVWWVQRDLVEVDHHGLSLQDVKTADAALARLTAGNKCYVDEHFDVGDGRRTVSRRQETSERQHPYAAILACSDSRVGPEILFSAGLGDLFVVRVAGNIVDPRCYGVLGSLEYAVEELKVPLIVVLGHEGCGAVKAAIRVIREKVELPGAIAMLAATIQPVIEASSEPIETVLHKAVMANVEAGVQKLRSDGPILGPRLKQMNVAIVGAVYDLKSGLVRFLTE
jgi:carbonic anhydrase